MGTQIYHDNSRSSSLTFIESLLRSLGSSNAHAQRGAFHRGKFQCTTDSLRSLLSTCNSPLLYKQHTTISFDITKQINNAKNTVKKCIFEVCMSEAKLTPKNKTKNRKKERDEDDVP